jgi:hypothetical protein
MNTSGEGKYQVFLNKIEMESDLIYILGGGEKPHVGGIVICEPDKKPQIIKFENHYDHIVLKPIAIAACKKYNKRIVVIGGVHVDNATKDEINLLVKNCNELVKCI